MPKTLSQIPQNKKQNGEVRCLQWAPGHKLFTAGSDKNIAIWKIGQNKQFVQDGAVTALGDVWCIKVIDPFLFAGVEIAGQGGLVQGWNMQSGVEYKLLKNNGPSHAQRVYALEANAASGILFSGGGGIEINDPKSDPIIRAWKIKDDQSAFDLLGEMPGHKAGIKALQIVGDNKFLISGSFDGQIGVYNAADGSALSMMQGHNAPVYTLSSTKVGNDYYIMSAGADPNINIYKLLPNGSLKGEIQKPHGMRNNITVFSLAITHGHLIVGFSDGTIKIFTVPSMGNAGFWKPHQGSIYNIAPAEDVKGFITGSQDQKFSCYYFK